MQLGTRWALGDEPPSRLPDAIIAAIREVEEAARKTQGAADHSHRRWTLTWLEGRPLVELDPDSGSDDVTAIRFNPEDGTASITTSDPDEELLDE